jgi:hypothetical protein
MIKRSKDSTEPLVGCNCTCEFVYFIAWHSMHTFQFCHVQCCSHSPLSEIKKGFSDQTLFITVNQVNRHNM